MSQMSATVPPFVPCADSGVCRIFPGIRDQDGQRGGIRPEYAHGRYFLTLYAGEFVRGVVGFANLDRKPVVPKERPCLPELLQGQYP